MKQINVGLIGFGTIGSGVYNLLNENSALIGERTGLDIKIKSICDLRVDHVKSIVRDTTVTDNWKDIVEDDDIDIVIELVGGIEPAKTIVLNSFKNGKSVVTANKKLLAEDGAEIFKLAGTSGNRIGYEASVAGGIPSIIGLRTGLVGNRIRSITGILNGTTNYILTKMKEEGQSFSDVLKIAQEKGFAEADPTFDIEGYDAGHKIALLAMISYNKKVDFKSIPIEGITKVSSTDISYADDMGYAIKLLGIAKMADGKLDIRVHPTMIPKTHLLASVRNEYNAVMFDGDMTDPVILYGKGAGSLPTASAVISDIVQIAEKSGIKEHPKELSGDAEFLPAGERLSRYYIRMHTEDRPGILSRISGVFGENGISIASVIQKEFSPEYASLIIMTHTGREDKTISAIEEIGRFDFVDNEIILIRVEDSLFSGAADG